MLLLLLSAATTAEAAEPCPWYTQGSAAKLLGGDVTAAIVVTSLKQGSCKFMRTTGDSIELYVDSELPAPCPAASEKVAGIGNEAGECVTTSAAGETVNQLDARVRAVRFTMLLQAKHAIQPDAQQDALRQAAEQVAGNLF